MSESLMSLVEEGDAEGVRRRLAEGADPLEADEEGVPVALHAADTGRVELVAPFIERGVSIGITDDCGFTLLHAAVNARSLALVEWLLARGADPNRCSATGDDAKTPLHAALQDGGDLDVVAALVRHGADVNAHRGDDWTPLMLASQEGPLDVVALLLDAGADPGTTRAGGRVDAASVAEHWNRTEVLELLRSRSSR